MNKKGLLHYSDRYMHNSLECNVISDAQHKIKSITQYFSMLCGFAGVDDMIGLTVFDLKCPAVKIAHVFRDQDEKVIKEQRKQYYFNINRYIDNTVKCFLTIKYPIFSDNTLIGQEHRNRELSTKNLDGYAADLYNSINYINGKNDGSLSLHIIDNFSEHRLTIRESEIIYLVAMGRSASVIADMLSISNRTVESHIINIKIKLGITKKYQLIDFYVANDLIYKIPGSLLPTLKKYKNAA